MSLSLHIKRDLFVLSQLSRNAERNFDIVSYNRCAVFSDWKTFRLICNKLKGVLVNRIVVMPPILHSTDPRVLQQVQTLDSCQYSSVHLT